MRNRLIAGKSKRRCIAWGVGYFKPPGEILSRKPGAKSCGFLAVDFWLSCGPRASSQWSQGQGLCRDSVTTTACMRARTGQAPGILAATPPPPSSCSHTHQASWGTAAATAVLDSRAAERRVSLFFSPFSLRACCLTKPLVTLDFSSSFCTKCGIITK